jgi:sugar lactone lactonase YvrE
VSPIDGAVYVSDTGNHVIRRLDAAGGAYTTVQIAGNGTCSFANGVGTSAGLCEPTALAFDTAGTLYVADTGNNSIRQLVRGAANQYAMTTIAGRADQQCGAADGTSAGFCQPQGLAFNGGTLYVADTGNGTVRALTQSGSQWSAATLSGVAHKHGTVPGALTQATLNAPTSVAVTPTGDLVVVEANENAVLLLRVP